MIGSKPFLGGTESCIKAQSPAGSLGDLDDLTFGIDLVGAIVSLIVESHFSPPLCGGIRKALLHMPNLVDWLGHQRLFE